ncbi:MAG TPA: sodium:proton antiporter [Chthoniobacter sp.]|jgi:Na+/H+ antiporter NhaD/arsenite permease-like protein
MLLAAAIIPDPHPLFILPFVALLLCIATMPLLLPKIWEHHYKKISLGLGAIAAIYYLIGLRAGGRMLDVAWEYVSFIVFIGSLFTVAGGIHVRTKGEAVPSVNALYLIAGAILANLVGTTGASMLLIRPWIRMNKYRFTSFHTVFFIFIVSNVGGCLTPIGDPPLFLGYLKGVPFWWVTVRCLPAWALAVGCIVAIFYALDRMNFLAAPRPIREMQTAHEEFKINGLQNLGWLAVILASVFLKQPPGLREVLMVLAAVGSYFTTGRQIHEANHFTFGPIKEVAWLFAGIFTTMVPALDYLECHAGALGISAPVHFYWFSGALSGVLDNAPTYLTFLTAAFGQKNLNIDDTANVARFLTDHGLYVVAVSLGSVFFGAMTYIGNGPNFMVKAIADHAKVHTPNFFLYIIRFSAPVLLPVFALVAWLFLRK